MLLLEDAVYKRKNVPVASEVVGEFYQAFGVRCANSSQMTFVDLDVGATETIDALLRIPHRAKAAAALARHARNHIHLKLVGILEFVDHDKLELMGEFSSDAFMLAKRPSRLDKQVVVVEHAPFTLGAPSTSSSKGSARRQRASWIISAQRAWSSAATALYSFDPNLPEGHGQAAHSESKPFASCVRAAKYASTVCLYSSACRSHVSRDALDF